MNENAAGTVATCVCILASGVAILLYLNRWHSEYTEESSLRLADIEARAADRAFAELEHPRKDETRDPTDAFRLNWSTAIHAHRLRMERNGQPMTDAEFESLAEKPFVDTKTDWHAVLKGIDPLFP